MGWKNVKDHYRIEYIVCVNDKGICIGSGFVEDILIVAPDGTLLKRNDIGGEVFDRYQKAIEADPQVFRHLIETPDQFEKSIAVYTYSGADIIEKQAEEVGYPNVTHDGELMNDNEFSTDKQRVIAWAKQNATSNVQGWQGAITHLEKELDRAKASFGAAKVIRIQLNSSYPTAEDGKANTSTDRQS